MSIYYTNADCIRTMAVLEYSKRNNLINIRDLQNNPIKSDKTYVKVRLEIVKVHVKHT